MSHLVDVNGWRVTLELDLSIPGLLLALPPLLAWYDAEGLRLPERRDASRLPPLVVRGVGYVQNLPVLEGQPVRGQTVVLVWVIVEQRPGTNLKKIF